MLPIFRFFILCVLLFSLSACGGNRYKTIMPTLTHIDQAIVTLGPPVNVVELPDGRYSYLWRSGGGGYGGGIRPHVGVGGGFGSGWGTFGGISLSPGYSSDPCEIRVLTDAKGNIVNWAATGDNCDKLIATDLVGDGAAYTPPDADTLSACLKDRAQFHIAKSPDMTLEALTTTIETDCLTFTGKSNEDLSSTIAKKTKGSQ